MSVKVRGGTVRLKIIFLVLLLVVPLILLGIAGTLYYQGVIRQNIDNDNLDSARTVAALTPEYMNATQLYLKSIADRPLVIKAMGDNDTAFLHSMADYTNITSRVEGVYFVDVKGTIIDKSSGYDVAIGSNASQQPSVKEVLKSGKSVIGDAVSGPNGMPVVPIGVPVANDNGTLLGVVVGNVDLGEFAKAIQSTSESKQQYIYMVNRTGHIMVHNNPDYMRTMRDFSSVSAVQQVMNGESGVVENYNPIENMSRLAAYAPVEPMGWSVVVAVPVNVAYKPVWDATWMALGVIAAFTLIVLGLGLYVGNGIARPIISLSQAIKEVDDTDDYRGLLPLSRKDEIGELAHSFDDMVAATRRENRERSRAEEALRGSEEKFRLLADFTYDWETWTDPAGKYVYVSPSCERVSGHRAGEFYDNPGLLREIVHPDDRAALDDHYKERLQKASVSESFEFRIVTKGGETRWLSHHCQPVFDSGGEWLGRRASNRDITERKLAEAAKERLLARLKAKTAELQDVNEEIEVKNEELAAQAEELECANEELRAHNEELQTVSKSLHETQDYLESLINYANAPIIVWDPAFTITRFNKAFEWLSGYTAREVIGNNLSLLFPPDSREESLDKIKKTLEGEQWESVEIPVLHKYGSVRIALWNSANIYDDKHNLLATIAQGQDITRRKQAEKELAEAKVQAELYLDLMGHDISNLHQIMMMQLELAADIIKVEGKLEVESRELIDSSLATLDKATRLINNVRKLQKHQSGELSLEPTDLTEILKDVLKEYSDLPGKEVTIRFTPDGKSLVRANPLLKDVFSNLVDNAVKHTGGPLRLVVNINRISLNGSAFYQVAIEDNGNGIPDDKKDEVFHRFKRGQTKARGTGLGLYIVKTLVEGFGGYVEIQNKVLEDYTKGTRFLVYLPVMEGEDAGNV